MAVYLTIFWQGSAPTVVCKMHMVSEPDRYNRDFTELYHQDELRFMQNAKKIQLKDGHY